jgi:hypothetical protein
MPEIYIRRSNWNTKALERVIKTRKIKTICAMFSTTGFKTGWILKKNRILSHRGLSDGVIINCGRGLPYSGDSGSPSLLS